MQIGRVTEVAEQICAPICIITAALSFGVENYVTSQPTRGLTEGGDLRERRPSFCIAIPA